MRRTVSRSATTTRTSANTPIKRKPTKYLKEESQQTKLTNRTLLSPRTAERSTDTFFEVDDMTQNSQVLIPEDPTLEKTYKGHSGPISSFSFDVNTEYLVSSSSSDSKLLMWNTKRETELAIQYPGHTGGIMVAEFAPSLTNFNLFASGGKDKLVRLWLTTYERDEEIRSTVIAGHSDTIRDLSFSHDDSARLLVTCSDDETVKVWDVHDERIQRSTHYHDHKVRTCDMSSFNSAIVLSGAEDCTMKLYDMRNSNCLLCSYPESKYPIADVSFHPANDYLITNCSVDGVIRVYDCRTNQKLMQWVHEGGANSVSYHVGGRYLLSAGTDKTTKIWDLEQGMAMYTLEGHMGSVSKVLFSRDGSQFATGAHDNVIMLWRTNFDQFVPEYNEERSGFTEIMNESAHSESDADLSTSRVKLQHASPYRTAARLSTNARYSHFNQIKQQLDHDSKMIDASSISYVAATARRQQEQDEEAHVEISEETQTNIDELPVDTTQTVSQVSVETINRLLEEKQKDQEIRKLEIERVEKEEEISRLKYENQQLQEEVRNSLTETREVQKEFHELIQELKQNNETSKTQSQQFANEEYFENEVAVKKSEKNLEDTLSSILEQLTRMNGRLNNLESIALNTEKRVESMEYVLNEKNIQDKSPREKEIDQILQQSLMMQSDARNIQEEDEQETNVSWRSNQSMREEEQNIERETDDSDILVHRTPASNYHPQRESSYRRSVYHSEQPKQDVADSHAPSTKTVRTTIITETPPHRGDDTEQEISADDNNVLYSVGVDSEHFKSVYQVQPVSARRIIFGANAPAASMKRTTIIQESL